MKLEHIALNLSDARAAAKWYEANLDMRIVKSFDDPPHIHFLADESGSNCELTEPGKTVDRRDVIIHRPANISSMLPVHATEMYAKNLYNFLSPMIKDGQLALDWNDEVIKDSALTHEGQIRHEPTRKQVGG
jgi:NAD/NADP transhydrogenase alpha subunit